MVSVCAASACLLDYQAQHCQSQNTRQDTLVLPKQKWQPVMPKLQIGTGLPHTLIFGFGYVTIRRIIGPDVNTRINTHSVNTFLHRNNGNRR